MSTIERKEFSRLPKQVIPHHYDITLTPNLTTFLFTGTEDVHIDVSTGVVFCMSIIIVFWGYKNH